MRATNILVLASAISTVTSFTLPKFLHKTSQTRLSATSGNDVPAEYPLEDMLKDAGTIVGIAKQDRELARARGTKHDITPGGDHDYSMVTCMYLETLRPMFDAASDKELNRERLSPDDVDAVRAGHGCRGSSRVDGRSPLSFPFLSHADLQNVTDNIDGKLNEAYMLYGGGLQVVFGDYEDDQTRMVVELDQNYTAAKFDQTIKGMKKYLANSP